MNDPAALRPLHEAEDSIRRLREYDSTAELAAAVEAVAAAIDRSLRLCLRSSTSTPEAERLSALSPDQIPPEDIVRALRAQDLISIRLAGTVHELRAAAARARGGEPRASDPDVALRAVDQLRSELAAEPAPSGPAGPGSGREAGSAGSGTAAGEKAPDGEAAGRPLTERPAAELGAGAETVPPERRGRWMAWLAAGVALLGLVLLAWVLTRGVDNDYRRGVAMFRADRLDSAAVVFRQVLDDRPRHVSSMLYLGRIHRRQGDLQEARTVLRAAVGEAPGDPDVRREMGHLFMDLRQYRSAITQYERAVELDPDEMRNWVALIGALRAADDPRADRLLRDAPPDVQALLGGPDP